MAHRKRRRFKNNPRPRRHFRRNPRSDTAGFLTNSLLPAAIGAGGAIGVDLLMGNMPLPGQMRRGSMLPIVRIGMALLVGALVGAVSNKQAGEEAAAGGIIVTLYSLGKPFLMRRMPALGLARYMPLRGMGQVRLRRRRRLMGLGQVRRRMMRLRGLGRDNPNLQAEPRINTNDLYVGRPEPIAPQRNRFGRVANRAGPGVLGLDVSNSALTLKGGQGNWTKYRVPRTGGGNLGYIGPARTLGRYMQK